MNARRAPSWSFRCTLINDHRTGSHTYFIWHMPFRNVSVVWGYRCSRTLKQSQMGIALDEFVGPGATGREVRNDPIVNAVTAGSSGAGATRHYVGTIGSMTVNVAVVSVYTVTALKVCPWHVVIAGDDAG